ncbi:hypothetical protein CEXT_470971, partial [Caerostris extrusa]
TISVLLQSRAAQHRLLIERKRVECLAVATLVSFCGECRLPGKVKMGVKIRA